MVNKKAQMKIQQMAFMLVAITLFFILVGLFILAIQFAKIRGIATDLNEENAQRLVTVLANSPEFACGDSFEFGDSNCVDFDKVMALKQNSEKYGEFWGVASIEIVKTYPKDDGECLINNYEECGIVKVFETDKKSGPAQSVFVSLCKKESENEKVYGKCEIAKLLISYEDKR